MVKKEIKKNQNKLKKIKTNKNNKDHNWKKINRMPTLIFGWPDMDFVVRWEKRNGGEKPHHSQIPMNFTTCATPSTVPPLDTSVMFGNVAIVAVAFSNILNFFY